MLRYSPLTKSNPAGLFIQAFADTTKIPEASPLIPTTTPVTQWNHVLKRSHPYRKKPSAIASIKNAVPSREKGIPNIGPACLINVGQSRPSSNDSTVPDTAPVAKKMATPLLQAFVKFLYT